MSRHRTVYCMHWYKYVMACNMYGVRIYKYTLEVVQVVVWLKTLRVPPLWLVWKEQKKTDMYTDTCVVSNKEKVSTTCF